MLEVGNGGMTSSEYRSHFFLWAALKSPLIIGADLRTINNIDLDLLRAEEVIAINQDPLGISAKLVYRKKNKYDIWGGPLAGNEAVVVLFNRSSKSLKIKLALHLISWISCKQIIIRDLITKDEKSVSMATLLYESALIESHDSVILRLKCE